MMERDEVTMSSPEEEADETTMATRSSGAPLHQIAGIALCLSGGGFRAALFHLGALRRLNELGILSKIDTISSVSGGSIIAAHLASHISANLTQGAVIPDWEDRIAAPFRSVARRNLRTGPLVRRLLPQNWFRESAAIEGLEANFERDLTRHKLADLPARPSFVFCATDLTFGVNWIFERYRMGDYQVGYADDVAHYPVAHAVAASACFPPVFPPMAVNLKPAQLQGGKMVDNPKRNKLIAGLRLVDGGMYDNLGLEPVWKSHRVVLVSDGGAPFNVGLDTNWFLRLNRYVSVLSKQASALRRRWLMASYRTNARQGVYWGISATTETYGRKGGYPEELAQEFIATIRTDLDAFSDPEIAVLENHGYLVADAAINKRVPDIVEIPDVPLSIPHTKWMNPQDVERALAKSHEVYLPGRW